MFNTNIFTRIQHSTFQRSHYIPTRDKTNQHRKQPRKTKPLFLTMAAIITSPIKPTQPYHLDLTDDEVQRGRKRRRSADHTPPAQIPSTGSTAMRGRCRHRSLSASQTFSPSDLSPSSDRGTRAYRVDSPGGRGSPRRKFMKKNLVVPDTKRRRSQSPSRSRSLNGVGTPKPRRRQRTRSRSRSHRIEGNVGDGVGGGEKEAVDEN